jgi:hypothetical protein
VHLNDVLLNENVKMLSSYFAELGILENATDTLSEYCIEVPERLARHQRIELSRAQAALFFFRQINT